MKVDGVAAALQHDAAKIIGRQATGRSTPIGESVDVAEEKILQALIEKKFQPQGAAVGKGQDEGGQATAGTTEGDFAKVGPVGLRLLTGESAQAQKGLTLGRAQFGHHAAKLSHAAGVAALADHLEQTGSAQTRILLQGLAQEVEVRIGEAVTQSGM